MAVFATAEVAITAEVSSALAGIRQIADSFQDLVARSEEISGGLTNTSVSFINLAQAINQVEGQIATLDRAFQGIAAVPGLVTARAELEQILATLKEIGGVASGSAFGAQGFPALVTSQQQAQSFVATMQQAIAENQKFDLSLQLGAQGFPAFVATQQQAQSYNALLEQAIAENQKFNTSLALGAQGFPAFVTTQAQAQSYVAVMEQAIAENQKFDAANQKSTTSTFSFAGALGNTASIIGAAEGGIGTLASTLANFAGPEVGAAVTAVIDLGTEIVSLGEKIGGAILNFAKLGNELTTFENQTKAIFQSSGEASSKAANTFALEWGVASTDFLRAVNNIGAGLGQFGIQGERAEQIATTFTENVVKIATALHIDVPNALRAASQGLEGGARQFRELQQRMTDSALAAELFKNHLIDSIRPLSDVEKATGTLLVVQEEANRLTSAADIGQQSIATQLAAAAAGWDNLKRSLANLISPFVVPLVHAFTDIVSSLDQNIQKLVEYEQKNPKFKQAVEEFTTDVGNLATVLKDGLAKEIENLPGQIEALVNAFEAFGKDPIVKGLLHALEVVAKAIENNIKGVVTTVDTAGKVVNGTLDAIGLSSKEHAAKISKDFSDIEFPGKHTKKEDDFFEALSAAAQDAVEHHKSVLDAIDAVIAKSGKLDPVEKQLITDFYAAGAAADAQSESQDNVSKSAIIATDNLTGEALAAAQLANAQTAVATNLQSVIEAQTEHAQAIADANQKVTDALNDRNRAQASLEHTQQDVDFAAKDAADRVAEARESSADRIKKAEQDLSDFHRDSTRKIEDDLERVAKAKRQEAEAFLSAELAMENALLRGTTIQIGAAAIQLHNAKLAGGATGSLADAEKQLQRDREDNVTKLGRLNDALDKAKIDGQRQVDAAVRAQQKQEIDGKFQIQQAQDRLNDATDKYLDTVAKLPAAIAAADAKWEKFAVSVGTTAKDLDKVLADLGLFLTFFPTALGGGIVPGRAAGGDFPADTPFWVGEKGPEIVQFSQPGHVTSNTDSRKVAAAQQHTFNIFEAVSAEATALAVEARIMRGVNN